MTHYPRRLLAALLIVLAATAPTACGGDGAGADPTTSAGEQANEQSAPPTPEEPTSFDEVPGDALSYLGSGEKFTVQVKPIQFQWNSQFADKPADPGSKFLVVFTALRPELRDRGVEKLKLDELWLRYEDQGTCEYPSYVGNVANCFVQSRQTVQPIPLSERDWRSESWHTMDLLGVKLDAGVDYRAPLVFQVKDGSEPKNGFQICANPDGDFTPDKTELPCVPVPQS